MTASSTDVQTTVHAACCESAALGTAGTTYLKQVNKAGEEVWGSSGDVSDTLAVLHHHLHQHQHRAEGVNKQHALNAHHNALSKHTLNEHHNALRNCTQHTLNEHHNSS